MRELRNSDIDGTFTTEIQAILYRVYKDGIDPQLAINRLSVEEMDRIRAGLAATPTRAIVEYIIRKEMALSDSESDVFESVHRIEMLSLKTWAFKITTVALLATLSLISFYLIAVEKQTLGDIFKEVITAVEMVMKLNGD